MIWFWYNLVPLACVIGAAAIAMTGHEGWGWFLIVAVIAMVHPSSNDDEDDGDDGERDGLPTDVADIEEERRKREAVNGRRA